MSRKVIGLVEFHHRCNKNRILHWMKTLTSQARPLKNPRALRPDLHHPRSHHADGRLRALMRPRNGQKGGCSIRFVRVWRRIEQSASRQTDRAPSAVRPFGPKADLERIAAGDRPRVGPRPHRTRDVSGWGRLERRSALTRRPVNPVGPRARSTREPWAIRYLSAQSVECPTQSVTQSNKKIPLGLVLQFP